MCCKLANVLQALCNDNCLQRTNNSPTRVYNKRWCNHDNKTPLVLFGSLYSNLLKVLCDVVLVR